jgi:hypothetical protein
MHKHTSIKTIASILKKEEYVAAFATWEYTRWLVVSSCFFMVPSAYAYYNQLYFNSYVLLLTSLISANYWRKATYSWRRSADLIFAKISFFIFLVGWVAHVTNYNMVLVGVFCASCMGASYEKSVGLREKKSPHWYKYHVGYHFSTMVSQLIVLNAMINYVDKDVV